MHPRIAEVLDQFDLHAAAVDRAVAAIPPALRTRRPSPDRWSAAEVMEHVALVEGRINGLLTPQVDAARAAGLGPERDTTPVGPTFDLTRLLDRSRPLVASDPVQPNAALDADAAAEALARQRDALRAVLLGADGLALGEVIVSHPRFGALNIYQWSLFAAGHEARHAAQIAELAVQLQGVDGAT